MLLNSLLLNSLFLSTLLLGMGRLQGLEAEGGGGKTKRQGVQGNGADSAHGDAEAWAQCTSCLPLGSAALRWLLQLTPGLATALVGIRIK